MGREQILEKLNRELEKEIHSECQVIYILSRIRKYLELKNLKKKYKFLNFYCNWSLHSKIDRTEPVADVLREFIKGSDEGKFLDFDYFVKDLRRFLKENQLSERILETSNYLKFLNLLLDICSETPVEVFPEEKRTIIIARPKKSLEDSVFSVSCRIN